MLACSIRDGRSAKSPQSAAKIKQQATQVLLGKDVTLLSALEIAKLSF